MKYIFFISIITVLFIGCEKNKNNNTNNNISDNAIEIENTFEENESNYFESSTSENVAEENKTDNSYLNRRRSSDGLNTIEDIIGYIYNDFNLNGKWSEDSLDLKNFLAFFNIKDYKITRERSYESIYGDVVEDYDIESGPYRVHVYGRKNDRYSITSLEIELNGNNYLQLFPYKSMDEYMDAKNIGDFCEIYAPEKYLDEFYGRGNYIRCKIRDDDTVCDLIFNDGLLKSIILKPASS
jgi:hypothetical protein